MFGFVIFTLVLIMSGIAIPLISHIRMPADLKNIYTKITAIIAIIISSILIVMLWVVYFIFR